MWIKEESVSKGAHSSRFVYKTFGRHASRMWVSRTCLFCMSM